eukprot:scaffold52146_cov35-Attheya_sp.AAC.1
MILSRGLQQCWVKNVNVRNRGLLPLLRVRYFHSTTCLFRKTGKGLSWPGLSTVVVETREEGNIQSVNTIGVIARSGPLENLRPYAKNTLKRKQLFKTAGMLEMEMEKEERVVIEAQHEEARKRIVNGEVLLNYQEIRSFCKHNGLGKAVGTKETLENRLLTYFRRVDPIKLKEMGRWELLTIKDNLDGDKDYPSSEEGRKKYGAMEDR